MKNSYSTPQEAQTAWESSELWKTERSTVGMVAAICYNDDHYFIIANRICVEYRERLKQVVGYL